MSLALAADVRFAGPHAKFAVGAVKVGVSAGECGISYHLPRLIGGGRAFQLMPTGRVVDVAEAYGTGLATMLAGDDDLLFSALVVARTIAQKAVPNRSNRPSG